MGPQPSWGRWGLAILAYCPLKPAENNGLGQVGSRIAIIPREKIRKSFIDGHQRIKIVDSPPYDSRARKPHLPHCLLKAAVYLSVFAFVGQVGSESPKPHLPHISAFFTRKCSAESHGLDPA
jgi:hypothetical protein